MLFVTLFSEMFASTANLLIVIADRISRVLKTFGAAETVAIDIYQRHFTESGILVFFSNLYYMALWKGVLSYCVISQC